MAYSQLHFISKMCSKYFHLKGIPNCPKRMSLFDLTYKMSMDDPIAASVETPKIDSRRSLEKEFIELIHMIP